MSVKALLAASAATAALALAASSPAQAQASELTRGELDALGQILQEFAGSAPDGQSQQHVSPRGDATFNIAFRRAYPASQGPGNVCGNCVDPCRSFRFTLVAPQRGTGEFSGVACRPSASSAWALNGALNAESRWVAFEQPERVVETSPPPPPPAPEPNPEEERRARLYSDTNRNDLVRLGYAEAGDDDLADAIERFLADSGYPVAIDAALVDDDTVNRVTRWIGQAGGDYLPESKGACDPFLDPEAKEYKFGACVQIGRASSETP